MVMNIAAPMPLSRVPRRRGIGRTPLLEGGADALVGGVRAPLFARTRPGAHWRAICTGVERRRQMLGKIAVVEDEDIVRGFLTTILEDRGYEVVAFSNCTEATRALVETSPELLIVDV